MVAVRSFPLAEGGTRAAATVADDEVLVVRPGVVIPAAELTWRFSASGGPGGQHVNTSNTRAEVRFDIASSPSLSPVVRRRLQERLGDSVAVAASDHRSQSRNRELALQRLASRMAGALRVQKPRRPTRPTPGAQRRRLEAKRRQGLRKQERRARGDDDG
jgi:ribosome-associated protein